MRNSKYSSRYESWESSSHFFHAEQWERKTKHFGISRKNSTCIVVFLWINKSFSISNDSQIWNFPKLTKSLEITNQTNDGIEISIKKLQLQTIVESCKWILRTNVERIHVECIQREQSALPPTTRKFADPQFVSSSPSSNWTPPIRWRVHTIRDASLWTGSAYGWSGAVASPLRT